MRKYKSATSGLLLSKVYPDEGQVDYAYDALNRQVSTTWTREVSPGVRLKAFRTYAEKTGELVSVSYNDGTVGETHAYNHLGQITQSTDASGTRVYIYNQYNEIESETLTGDGVAHAVTELRDAFGRGTGYTYAKAGTLRQTTGVSYAEATGRIATACFVHGGAEKTFTYNYLSGTNLLESLVCPSNLTIMHAYEDKRDLVTGITIRRSTSTNVVLRNYTYDTLGRPITRTTARNGTTQSDAFSYNNRSELVSATLGNAEYAYAFDNIGNRATEAVAGTALAYSTNNLNQYTEIVHSSSSLQEEGDRAAGAAEESGDACTPTYDADGNATLIQTSTGTWQISYNAENRPIRFENAATQTVVDCGYDSQGRRYFKKVTVAGTVTLHHRYIYRGYLQIAAVDMTRSGQPDLWLVTWDPSQPTATRPLAIQKDGTWFTYGYDITKNVCEVFGQHGYIRTSYSYAPFGNVTVSGDVSQPFQWSSEVYDSEPGLVYYNFRHYSPDLGRFLSRDPIQEQGGLNLYAFVKNNPLQKWDSLGRFAPMPGCHLNSPTCGGNGMIFQPIDISIQPGGYLDAFNLFLDWLSGVHQNPTIEEINSPRSVELSQSHGGRYFVDFVQKKYKGVHCSKWGETDNFDYDFRTPYRFVVNLPYGIAHFVGSFQDGVSSVYSCDEENCEITMLFKVDNYSTWESFLYGATEIFDDSQSLGKTWKQTYQWTETFYCCNS